MKIEIIILNEIIKMKGNNLTHTKRFFKNKQMNRGERKRKEKENRK